MSESTATVPVPVTKTRRWQRRPFVLLLRLARVYEAAYPWTYPWD